MTTITNNVVLHFTHDEVAYTATKQTEPFIDSGVSPNLFSGVEFWLVETDQKKRSVTIRPGEDITKYKFA